MRVLISVDMEGVAGVTDPADITPGAPEWQLCRGYLTDEASAAVQGVIAFDPDAEVLVADAHARGRNLVPDRLDPRGRLIRGVPRRLDMLAGVDDDVDAVCMIGYHGRAGRARSVLAHTFSGGTIAAIRCQGRALGEIGLNAALAAHYGVPTVLVSGDDTVAEEAAVDVPGVTTVVVKRARGNRSAESLHPSQACEKIRAGVTEALGRRSSLRPPVIEGPVDLEVAFLRPHMTERALLIPQVRAVDATTIGIEVADFPTAYALAGLFADLASIT